MVLLCLARSGYGAEAMTSVPLRIWTPSPDSTLGAWLVLASAVTWSVGGVFARLLAGLDPWTVIFWRSLFAALALAAFLLARDGVRGFLPGFIALRLPGVAVALAFASASTAFVVALQYTTVANILLVQAGAPLVAALLARVVLGERISRATAAAIAGVFVGVGVMVSGSLTGAGSPLGDALALWIMLAFAGATVITRCYASVRMVPAACLGTAMAAGVAATQAPTLAADSGELALLLGFGAVSLGGGLALFVTGARLVPAAVAALLGVAETVLGPVWVWLAFGETPGERTLIGGALVLVALLGHLALTDRTSSRRRAAGRGR